MSLKKKKNSPYHKRRMMIAILGICVLVLGLILYSLLNQPEPSDPLAFANAELARLQELHHVASEKWANRDFEDYRYQLQYGYASDCILTIVVENDVPSLEATTGSSCEYYNSEEAQSRLATIDSLMGEIQTQLEARECGPNGCVCDGYIVIRAIYHPMMGYPTGMQYSLTDNFPQGTISPRSLTPESPMVARMCTLVGFGGSDSLILDLEPLPDEE